LPDTDGGAAPRTFPPHPARIQTREKFLPTKAPFEAALLGQHRHAFNMARRGNSTGTENVALINTGSHLETVQNEKLSLLPYLASVEKLHFVFVSPCIDNDRGIVANGVYGADIPVIQTCGIGLRRGFVEARNRQ
jgi:hypothetical protein